VNAKKCKKLRRFARQATVGAPMTAYKRGAGPTTRLAPGCTRYLYKRLKREVRAIQRQGLAPVSLGSRKEASSE